MHPRLLVVTDPAWSDGAIVDAARAVIGAVPAGAVAFQLRDRQRPGRDVARLAERLRAACEAGSALLVVNDRVDVAVAVGARGVHLGGGSVGVADARRLLGPGAFVTVAAHGADDVARAARDGADAALLAPIFETPGKGPPIGTNAIARAKRRAPALGLYALGGVDASNAAACAAAGATGVAVVRAVLGAPDPAAAAVAILRAIAPPSC